MILETREELVRKIASIILDRVDVYEDHNWSGPCYGLSGMQGAAEEIMQKVEGWYARRGA